MIQIIVLGIDGTGPVLTDNYRHTMGMSFVRYIVSEAPTRIKKYLRGPGWEGLDMPAIASEGYQFVHLQRIGRPEVRVLLVGYSRGSTAVIDIAVRLASDGVKVDGMMLFDAVDRSPYPSFVISGYKIPTNVARVVHAVRDPHAFSRGTFGNAATTWHAPTKYETKTFWATHGGLGGVPWKPARKTARGAFVDEGLVELLPSSFVTFKEDELGAREVWRWAEPRLREMGFLP